MIINVDNAMREDRSQRERKKKGRLLQMKGQVIFEKARSDERWLQGKASLAEGTA